jgi:hypothetical protein
MSQSPRDIIPVMNLLQEMREQDYQVIGTKPHVYCKVFDDSSGALELARLPTLRPVLSRCPQAGGDLVWEILPGFLMRERCKWGDSNR